MELKQTAGRTALGEFAPKFAQLNDDVLFGEVWSRKDKLSLRDRSIVTVVALAAQGLTDSSLKYHLESAKKNGVSKTEIAEILTHAAFYMGWSKAWAVFRMAKEVWTEEICDELSAHANSMIFPVGKPNDGFAQYFVGQSYLAPISTEQVGIYNITFEPKCRNNWHIHHADKGGGQILICVSGRGWYQEWGKEAQTLHPGDTVITCYPDENRPFQAAVITLSDKGAKGERVDESGPAAKEMLEQAGYEVVETLILPDEPAMLKTQLMRLADGRQLDLVLTSGGTGFSMRDQTPEATMAVADRNAPGIAEAIRYKSMAVTDRAMLSRGVSVIRKKTLIVNLPGSPKAVKESLGFILDSLDHGLKILRGSASECARRD